MNVKAKTPMCISAEQYPLVVSRRQAFDNLLWQTPVLSLTAQSFLFSISLTGGNSKGARIIAAVLALMTAVASIQLMIKHRFHEERDSKLLCSYEENEENHLVIHGRADSKEQPWYVRRSSFELWLATLSLFALAAIVVLVSEVFGLGFL